MMEHLSRKESGKVTLGGNICLDPSEETEENSVEDAEYLTFIKIAKQGEKEVNEAATDIFHQLRKILMSCNNDEEDSEGIIHHGENASLVVEAGSDEESHHKEGMSHPDGDSQENPMKDAGVRSMSKMYRHEKRSGPLPEDDEIVTDVFHKLRKILMSCNNEEEDSDGSSHCDEDVSLDVEAGTGEERQPREETSPSGEDLQENPEGDAIVRTLSKTSNQEERSGPSLEDGDDEVATDIFHKLREALMSCNNGEEDDEGGSHHDENAASLDVEADPGEECHPKEEANPDDEDTQDEEEEEGSHCSKGADIMDEVCHTRTRRRKPPLKYQCGYCEKCFQFRSNLKAHERIHTRQKPYKCQFCEKCFGVSENRDSHEKTHTGEKPYECQYCTKAFASLSGLRKHKFLCSWKASSEGGYSVKAVSSQDSTNVDVNMHPQKKPYLCHHCGKSFLSLKGCKDHIDLHASGKFVVKSRPCKCDYCGRYFQCPSELKDHVRRHTGEKPFSCSICGKAFADKAHQKEHERVHTGEQPYKCEVCSKRFTWKRSWRRHKLRHEGIISGKGNIYIKTCPHCGKNYDSGHLKKHISRVHEKIKPYKCQVCERCFAGKSDLRKHELIHSRVKHYQCSFCGRLFSRGATCRNHEVARHIREKPKYSCQYCDKVYTVRTFLKLHEKRHFAEKKYYVCESCGQKYTSRCSLNRHERTHTGEKPYQCHICTKSFIRKDYRDDHVKTHKK